MTPRHLLYLATTAALTLRPPTPRGRRRNVAAHARLTRHDALRVSTGLGHALAVRCEHGGWSNLSVLACAFDAATLATDDNATEVTLETPTITVRGRYAAESADCAWSIEAKSCSTTASGPKTARNVTAERATFPPRIPLERTTTSK